MMRFLRILALLLMPLGLLAADKVSVTKSPDGIILANGNLRVLITPKGGKIASFTSNGVEYASEESASGANSGFDKFKLLEGSTVHSVFAKPFALTVESDTPERAVVKAEFAETAGPARGLVFTNRYELAAGENRLKCNSVIVSQNGTGKEFSPWMAHSMKLPRDPSEKKQTSIFAGATRGVFRTPGFNAPLIQASLNEITEPWWVAAVNSPKRNGLLMLGSSRAHSIYFWIGSEYFFTMEQIFPARRFSDDSRWTESVWQMPLNGLEAVHFAAPEFAGALEQEGLRLMPTVSASNVTVAYKLDGVPSGKKSFDAWKPGVPVFVELKAPEGFRNLTLTVTMDGRTIPVKARVNPDCTASEVAPRKGLLEATAASGKVLMSHAKETLYLTDVNLTAHFGMESTLPRTVKKCDLILELPESVTLANPSVPYTTQPVERNGKKLLRYTFKMAPRSYYAALTMYMKTTLPPGERADAWYYAKAPGVAQEPQHLSIASVSIPQCVRRPKRLLSGIGFYGTVHIAKWPEIYELMERCGATTISLRDETDVAAMRKVVERARQLGMYVKVNNSPATSKKLLKDDPEARATSIDGERCNEICPSYRGSAYQVEKAHLTRPAEAGASIVFWDTESWQRREYCFCDRCVEQFRQWFRKNAPGKTWQDPRKFELDPGANAEYHELWKRFRVALGAAYFGEIKREYVRKLAASGNGKGMLPPGVPPLFGLYGVWPTRGIYHQFMRFEEFAQEGILDVAMPSFYVGGDAAAVGRGVRKIRAALGTSRIVPFITAGASAEYETDARTLRHIMLEVFLNGSMGFAVWPYLGWDAEDIAALSETMNLVRPLEDIIADGKVMTGLSVDNRSTTAVGLELENQGALLVSDYSKRNLPDLTLTLTVKAAADLFDVGSGEKLASLKKGQNQVRLKAYGDRARVLYFGKSAPDVDFKLIPSAPVKVEPAKPKQAKTGGAPLKIAETKSSVTVANAFYGVEFNRATGVITRITWGDGKRSTRRPSFNESTILVKNDYLLGKLSTGRANFELVREGTTSATVRITSDVGTTNKPNAKPVTAVIEYTFTSESPLIRASFNVSTEDVYANCRINDFSFSGEDWTRIVTGPSLRLETMDGEIKNRTVKVKTRTKGYSYVGVADDAGNVLALVSSGNEPPGFLHIYTIDKFYLRGLYQRLNAETLAFSQRLYIGPADQMDTWIQE